MSQNSKILVSIGVATCNHEQFIERAIESILLQKTEFAYEIIIHDDCSADSTRNILEKYKAKGRDLEWSS
ncbi:MAG: glycosyltransferase [Bacteroidia bacterium]|nr:glycosyltransferase [Bacteroidia bacterium]